LGWTDGRNVRMDLRWGGGDADRIQALAQELVGLQPDLILATSTVATAALQRETRTIPIVFASVIDPVASGLVARLDRPSGNITGFANSQPTIPCRPPHPHARALLENLLPLSCRLADRCHRG
jgi:putative ABC transport system substrate-binding protein